VKRARLANPPGITAGQSYRIDKVIRTLDDNRICGSAADLDFRIVPYG